MNLIGGFGLVCLVVIAMICILNTITFPRLGRLQRKILLSSYPSVSLLIPARNEEKNIHLTLQALLKQDYAGEYEIIVLDDFSEDNTIHEIKRAAQNDPRIRIITGMPLPSGWIGKNWACHQLAGLARGEILVFTDAGVLWKPTALSNLIGAMNDAGMDGYTVWPTQEAVSWPERLVVPMMMYAVMSYLPELCVRFIPWPIFSAANGQCLAFRKEVYWQIGGHEGIKNAVIEDVRLAWKTKANGFRLGMALGECQISNRMYSNWQEVRDGFAKNILAGHGGHPFFLILSALFHWMIFIYPYLWAMAGWFLPQSAGWPEVPFAMILLGLGVRALSAAATKHRVTDVLAMPVSVIMMTIISAQSLWWHFRFGGPRWKGRQIQDCVL
ncbi:MAG: glycosyltransferase [Anaerolineales bacterium]|nr:glycosyltransferase [Anaerolineales bacterium]